MLTSPPLKRGWAGKNERTKTKGFFSGPTREYRSSRVLKALLLLDRTCCRLLDRLLLVGSCRCCRSNLFFLVFVVESWCEVLVHSVLGLFTLALSAAVLLTARIAYPLRCAKPRSFARTARMNFCCAAAPPRVFLMKSRSRRSMRN